MTQGVKDALADAETLRRIARERVKEAFDFTYQYKQPAASKVRTLIHLCYFRFSSPTYDEARMFARAAFRAVPGLRGE